MRHANQKILARFREVLNGSAEKLNLLEGMIKKGVPPNTQTPGATLLQRLECTFLI